MYKFGKFIGKNRIIVLIIAVLLTIPSIFGMVATKTNYDMLTYLPKDLESVEGQKSKQLEEIDNIVKEYDEDGFITGEAPLTKDLITISDIDFENVNIISILVVFIIIAIVLQSISLPIILVAEIQLAIFINMGIPTYTHTVIPFVSSIVIGCIQLGSTVDYAILLTTRFKEELQYTTDKRKAMEKALSSSGKSIVTSAASFFAATIGVVFISKIDLISSLTSMMARGAIISMLVILFILPAILLVLEPVINKTTYNWKKTNNIQEEK
ncbi:MMPL family transporter [Clostridium chauvoei]|uniref:MMPL family transporter n=1 Tax=Clostridium chauvoei TaxID=46867 RepID=UPI0021A66D79|nr:MMPL family transporter [Clostridium chauvoei]